MFSKIENVRAWKPFTSTSVHKNDSTRGLPYQYTVHQALKIMRIHANGLMKSWPPHSEALWQADRTKQDVILSINKTRNFLILLQNKWKHIFLVVFFCNSDQFCDSRVTFQEKILFYRTAIKSSTRIFYMTQ